MNVITCPYKNERKRGFFGSMHWPSLTLDKGCLFGLFWQKGVGFVVLLTLNVFQLHNSLYQIRFGQSICWTLLELWVKRGTFTDFFRERGTPNWECMSMILYQIYTVGPQHIWRVVILHFSFNNAVGTFNVLTAVKKPQSLSVKTLNPLTVLLDETQKMTTLQVCLLHCND